MEIENKKIFISGIDTKLGYHLAQKLRDDHLKLQNYSYLVGSQATSNPANINPAVHAVINFQKDPVLLGKCVLQSDVIILDVRNATDEAEYILKLIQWKAKEESNERLSLEDDVAKKYVIVGIGSHMTWAHQKSGLMKFEGNDKEQALAKILAFDYEKEDKITDGDRDRRICHHSWVRQRDIEKSILDLNNSSCVRSCVITTGLFYGQDFPSTQLQNLVAKCYSLAEEVWIYGEGNNYLPTVRVDDFCDHLETVVQQLQLKNSRIPANLISVDQNLNTQLEMAQGLLKCSGYVKQIKKFQLNYLTKQEAIHSWSVPLTRSSLFSTIKAKSNSFCSYFRQNFSEITQYVELENYHYVLYAQEMDPEITQQLDAHLSTLIQVFREEDLTTEISKVKSSPKQEVDIHQVSRAIEEGFLKVHNQQSYVLILHHILLDVQVVKKYNLKKFQIDQVPQILRLKLKQSPIQQTTLTQKSIDINGDERKASQQRISRQIPENTIGNQDTIEKEEDPLVRRNKKYQEKVDQYLLDNVVCYLSEAFLQLKRKQKPGVPDLVEALKKIYSRQAKVYEDQYKYE